MSFNNTYEINILGGENEQKALKEQRKITRSERSSMTETCERKVVTQVPKTTGETTHE